MKIKKIWGLLSNFYNHMIWRIMKNPTNSFTITINSQVHISKKDQLLKIETTTYMIYEMINKRLSEHFRCKIYGPFLLLELSYWFFIDHFVSLRTCIPNKLNFMIIYIIYHNHFKFNLNAVYKGEYRMIFLKLVKVELMHFLETKLQPYKLLVLHYLFLM